MQVGTFKTIFAVKVEFLLDYFRKCSSLYYLVPQEG